MNRSLILPGQLQIASSEVARLRMVTGEQSPLTFGQLYLPHYFQLPPSRMHNQIGRRLVVASHERGKRIAIAAPRGHAKSTLVSLAYVLWSICYQRETHILLISNTSAQAETLLAHVAHELHGNTAILSDFRFLRVNPRSRAARSRTSKQEIITGNRIRVAAMGNTAQARGQRFSAHRPSLVVLDDIENDEHVRSDEQRKKLSDWFSRVVGNIGDERTNIVVIGTILHDDALLANLMNSQRCPGWKHSVYRAVIRDADHQAYWRRWEQIFRGGERFEGRDGVEGADRFLKVYRDAMLAGAEVLWPAREPYDLLMKTKMVIGKYAFAAEKQNDPVDPEDSLLAGTEVVYWDGRYGDFDRLRSKLGRQNIRCYMGCDPSLGEDFNRGDLSAIVVVVKHKPTGRLFVVEADIQRRKPDQLLHAILSHYERYGCDKLYLETNGFQTLLVDGLNRNANLQRLPFSIKPVMNCGNKQARIQSLQPLLHNGTIVLSHKHTTLLEQLERFPRARHDDGPDALELVVRHAVKREPSGGRVNI